MKKFWNWKSRKAFDQVTGEESLERTLTLNGTIAESSWFLQLVHGKLYRKPNTR